MNPLQAASPVARSPSGGEKEPPAAVDTGQEGPLSLLPAPPASALGDDAIAQLALVLTIADEQDRKTARTLQQLADQAATQEANQRVKEMYAKADGDSAKALAAGFGEALCGVFQVWSALDPCKLRSQVLAGLAETAKGSGDVLSALYASDAGRADAAAAKFEASAQAALRRYDQAGERAQSAIESMRKVSQFLQQYIETANAMRSTAASYRA